MKAETVQKANDVNELLFRRPVDGALHLAKLGYKLFPVTPNGKTPAVEGWQAWAESSTPQQIAQYGIANPTANWGVYCEPSGLLVVDIDNKGGVSGSDTVRGLIEESGKKFPVTLSVATPSGGYHIYFKGSARSRVKALGEGVDVKSLGGYVVAPGSRVNDRCYTIEQDAPVAPVPDWVSAKLRASERNNGTVLPEGELLPEGDRNNFLASLGGAMRAKGVAHDAILAALQIVSENQFTEPLGAGEVETIARSVARYAPEHAKAAASFPELTPAATKAIATRAGQIDPALVPPRIWYMKDRFIAGFISLIVSPGGTGKSTLTMLDAIALATGQPLSGYEVPNAVPVWLYNVEDPIEELFRRMIALSMHHKLPLANLNDIHISSGDEVPLVMAKANKDGVHINQDAIVTVTNYIRQNGIKVMIVDPFVQTHEVNENDNMQIVNVVRAFGQIARATNCSICFVHHTRKPSGKGKTDMYDARGASSLVNAVRIAHNVSTMSEDEAFDFDIEESLRGWYFRLDNAKANLHPPAERADWFKKVSIIIPNGDNVGSLENVELKRKSKERQDKKIICKFLYQLMKVGDKEPIHAQRKLLIKARVFKEIKNKDRWVERCHKEMREGVKHMDRVFKSIRLEGGKSKYFFVCEANECKDENEDEERSDEISISS
jgi:hypothetical protein